MKSRLVFLGTAVALAAVLVMSPFGPSVYAQEKSLPNPYMPVDGWAKELPAGRQWGSANTIAIDAKGNIWVGERCGGTTCTNSTLDPIMQFDPSGKLLKSFGSGMIVTPHAVYIDRQGNIWVTDNAAKDGKGFQIIKFSADGKELMRLGKPGGGGDGPDSFNQPNGLVVAPNGDIFVVEGHTAGGGTARATKFSKDGKFIKEWGGHGSGPGQFEVPHAIAIDSKGRIYIGDRNNKRIQIFDQDGKFIAEWKQFGAPAGIYIDRHEKIYVTDSQSQSTDPKVVSYNPGIEQGIRIGNIKDGKVTAFIPIPPPAGVVTIAPEGIVVDAKGNLYVADVAKKGVRKFAKQ